LVALLTVGGLLFRSTADREPKSRKEATTVYDAEATPVYDADDEKQACLTATPEAILPINIFVTKGADD
jgi:hypothetical protein